MDIKVPASAIRIDILCEFVAFAHRLNFSTTAQDLNISQPALSKHMSELEKELGVSLISRGRKTRLTAAGKIFSDYTLMMLHDYKNIIEKCRSVGESDSLEIRIQEPMLLDGSSRKVLEFIRTFFLRNNYVGFRMVPLRGTTSDKAIKNNRIDLGFYMAYGTQADIKKELEAQGLASLLVSEEYYAVWAHKTNPLLNKDKLVFEDIRNARILMTANNAFDYLTTSVQKMYTSQGCYAPLEIHTVDTLMEYLMLPQDGSKIYLFPESMLADSAMATHGDMIGKRVEDGRCKIGLYLIFPKVSNNTVLKSFVKQLDDQLREEARTQSSLTDKGDLP